MSELSASGIEVVAKRVRSRRIVAYVCLALSAAFLYGAAAFFSKAQEKLDSWERAEGTVISFKRERRNSKAAYYPQFRFTAADGQLHTVTSNSGSRPPAYEVGEKVEVLYSAADPGEAVINSFMGLYIPSLVLGFMGLFPGVMSCVLFCEARHQEKRLAGGV